MNGLLMWLLSNIAFTNSWEMFHKMFHICTKFILMDWKTMMQHELLKSPGRNFTAGLKVFSPWAIPGMEDRYILDSMERNWLLEFKRPYHVVANFGSLIHPDYRIGKDDTSQTAKRQLNADGGQLTDQPADTCGRRTLVRAPGWLACTGVPKGEGIHSWAVGRTHLNVSLVTLHWILLKNSKKLNVASENWRVKGRSRKKKQFWQSFWRVKGRSRMKKKVLAIILESKRKIQNKKKRFGNHLGE